MAYALAMVTAPGRTFRLGAIDAVTRQEGSPAKVRNR